MVLLREVQLRHWHKHDSTSEMNKVVFHEQLNIVLVIPLHIEKVVRLMLLIIISQLHRLLDSLVVECWLRVREVPGSIPSQGPRHTKDVLNGTSSALVSQELR